MGLRDVGPFLEILDTHFISSFLCSLVSLLACFLALFSVFHPCQHAVSGGIVPLETHPCSKLGLQSPVSFLSVLFKHVFLGRSLQLGHSLNTMFRGLICNNLFFFSFFFQFCDMVHHVNLSYLFLPTAFDGFVSLRPHELVYKLFVWNNLWYVSFRNTHH